MYLIVLVDTITLHTHTHTHTQHTHTQRQKWSDIIVLIRAASTLPLNIFISVRFVWVFRRHAWPHRALLGSIVNNWPIQVATSGNCNGRSSKEPDLTRGHGGVRGHTWRPTGSKCLSFPLSWSQISTLQQLIETSRRLAMTDFKYSVPNTGKHSTQWALCKYHRCVLAS